MNQISDRRHIAPEMVVTLLGTGAVWPEPYRFGPSTLVQAGNQSLLFDFGRGATIRLQQLGIHPSQITANFLTHFHSDHTVGLPDIWLTGMVGAIDGSGLGRTRPMSLIGPQGTAKLAAGLAQAYAGDIALRCACDGTPKDGTEMAVTEYATEGVIYEAEGVRVTAFEVDHHDLIKPAFGYRIDYQGRSAVISGDTRYCSNLISFAGGVDLIVHEVMMATASAVTAPGSRVPQVQSHHISPELAGRIFSATNPRLAVYTHLVMPGGGGAPPPTVDELVQATRTTYSGPLIVGADLARFTLSKEGVRVRKFDFNACGYPVGGDELIEM